MAAYDSAEIQHRRHSALPESLAVAMWGRFCWEDYSAVFFPSVPILRRTAADNPLLNWWLLQLWNMLWYNPAWLMTPPDSWRRLLSLVGRRLISQWRLISRRQMVSALKLCSFHWNHLSVSNSWASFNLLDLVRRIEKKKSSWMLIWTRCSSKRPSCDIYVFFTVVSNCCIAVDWLHH